MEKLHLFCRRCGLKNMNYQRYVAGLEIDISKKYCEKCEALENNNSKDIKDINLLETHEKHQKREKSPPSDSHEKWEKMVKERSMHKLLNVMIPPKKNSQLETISEGISYNNKLYIYISKKKVFRYNNRRR